MKSNFYKVKATVEQYIKMAHGYDGAEQIHELKEHLPKQSSILEIGSGPGADFKLLSQEYLVTGSDYSEEFISRLNKLFPEDTFLNLDAITLSTHLKFDALYSNKVLHHLTDEELQASILRQAHILNPNGIISHTFWKGNGTQNYDGMYVNNHTEEGLKKFFQHQFEILVLKTYKEFEDNDSLFLIAKKRD